MANEYAVNSADLKAIADVIRAKAGVDGALAFPDGFAEAIAAITSGGAAGGLVYDMGEFTVQEDINTNNLGYVNNGLNPMPNGIPHNLGDVPDLICVWTDHWAGVTAAPYANGTTMVGFIWLRGMTGLLGRASSAANYPNPLLCAFTMAANDDRLGGTFPSSVAYGLTNERLPNEQAFYTPTFGTSTWWRAGATYKYFVSKAWWTVGGEASA
ncbi:MAG: hypothetical protein IKU73_00815 [Clostridia bacterium]|nr:hypothetical protein [Clostridia bacterium]